MAVNRVYTRRIDIGYEGQISRVYNVCVVPEKLAANTRYGLALELDTATGNVKPLTAVANMYGFLARPFVTVSYYNDDVTQDFSLAPAWRACDVMKYGYMTVTLQGTVACVKGNPVFVRISGGTATDMVGSIHASATDAGVVELPNCYFRGNVDAGGVTEIEYGITMRSAALGG